MDFVVLRLLYGLSLAIIHQLLWNTGPSMGHRPPTAAVSFAAQFDPSVWEIALRGYTIMISLLIGIGVGLVLGLITFGAQSIRTSRRSVRR